MEQLLPGLRFGPSANRPGAALRSFFVCRGVVRFFLLSSFFPPRRVVEVAGCEKTGGIRLDALQKESPMLRKEFVR